MDVFLPFDALGTWDYILKVIAARKAWISALQWMKVQAKTIPEQYMTQVMLLLCRVSWKGYIKGLGSALTITDMATFLSQEWLSDSHIDCMLTVTKRLHNVAPSDVIPCTEIVASDFPSHILSFPLLASTPIASDYFTKAPKSIINFGTTIANAATACSHPRVIGQVY
jgi:hypothetical protein